MQAADAEFVQIVDVEDLQVYEKFVPLSRKDRMRGTHILMARGMRGTVDAWMSNYKRQYPPAGYGTIFTQQPPRLGPAGHDTNSFQNGGDIVLFIGSRSSSCD
jgi:hypothetical protein